MTCDKGNRTKRKIETNLKIKKKEKTENGGI